MGVSSSSDNMAATPAPRPGRGCQEVILSYMRLGILGQPGLRGTLSQGEKRIFWEQAVEIAYPHF